MQSFKDADPELGPHPVSSYRGVSLDQYRPLLLWRISFFSLNCAKPKLWDFGNNLELCKKYWLIDWWMKWAPFDVMRNIRSVGEDDQNNTVKQWSTRLLAPSDLSEWPDYSEGWLLSRTAWMNRRRSLCWFPLTQWRPSSHQPSPARTAARLRGNNKTQVMFFLFVFFPIVWRLLPSASIKFHSVVQIYFNLFLSTAHFFPIVKDPMANGNQAKLWLNAAF